MYSLFFFFQCDLKGGGAGPEGGQLETLDRSIELSTKTPKNKTYLLAEQKKKKQKIN